MPLGVARCQWSVTAGASGSDVTLATLPTNLAAAPARSVGSGGPLSRGQEKSGAHTIAQPAHAVTDELILAAVHAIGRPDRHPEVCAVTVKEQQQRTALQKQSPNLSSWGSSKAGVMTERPETFQQRRHRSGQTSSLKAEE